MVFFNRGPDASNANEMLKNDGIDRFFHSFPSHPQNPFQPHDIGYGV